MYGSNVNEALGETDKVSDKKKRTRDREERECRENEKETFISILSRHWSCNEKHKIHFVYIFKIKWDSIITAIPSFLAGARVL